MYLEDLRAYCLLKKGVEETMPFGNDTLVFKVLGKMFLLSGIDSIPMEMNVKCDPETALELRANYPCVKPGYHMNKKHWNTIVCDGTVADAQILKWVDDSYDLVVCSLPKKLQLMLQ